jgi:hypothetical protein
MVEEVLGEAGKDWCSIQEVAVTSDGPSTLGIHAEPIQTQPSLDNLIIPSIDVSVPSVDGNICNSPFFDDLESEFSYIPTSPQSSAWDSGMGEFDTPPMVDLELSNQEEEWRSISRSSNVSLDPLYLTPSQGESLLLELR